MTQLESALKNKTSREIAAVAEIERVSRNFLKKNIASGRIVIPKNNKRTIKKICGIGYGLRTKINANIGTSSDEADISDELEKLRVSVEYGADTVMDLSIGQDISGIRRAVLKESRVPVGTVPIYQAAQEATRRKGNFLKMTADCLLGVIQEQAEDGVDFMTIHAGVTRKTVSLVKKGKRILDIAYNYDITLSLGDGLRPGSILDATDAAQLSELRLLGKLARRAHEKKVQVIIEGPGHVPLEQIRKNVELEKRLCNDAPL